MRLMVSVWVLALFATVGAQAQARVSTAPDRTFNILAGDRAILAADENRDDLPCRVEPLDPSMDFELKFQAGYLVHLPMAELSRDGDRLHVLFRIQPQKPAEAEAVYFEHHFDVPPLAEDAAGNATLPGRYVLGPGTYKIDWLMRDRAGRVCSSHWVTEAASLEKYEELAAPATANSIDADRGTIFFEEPPVMRSGGGKRLLHVRILLNLSPLERSKPKLSEYEVAALVSMVRSIHREPTIGLFSATAFAVSEQKVIYEISRSGRIDFTALGEAIEAAPIGTVDFSALEDPESEPRFLAEVLSQGLAAGEDRADAVIILGPKVMREQRISEGLLNIDEGHPQIFHFAYNRNPRSYPWRGAIANALKSRGLVEYSIARPSNFGAALADLIERLGGS